MRYSLGLLALILIVSGGCAGGSYEGEQQVEVKVVNAWQSGKHEVVQIMGSDYYAEIGDSYFGSMHPKVGDCVKIWVSTYKPLGYMAGSIVPRLNRNIAPCQ